MYNGKNKKTAIKEIERNWDKNRWKDTTRTYSAEQVYKLRGSVPIEYSIARMGSEKLWNLLLATNFTRTMGALTGNQALQMVQAGLKSIYVSGWQVAADMNEAGEMYPDQSLYPANSAPNLVKRINNAFQRADQIQHMNGDLDQNQTIDWFVPIVADGEAGFGGSLNVFEFMKAMIRAGASGVHFEDQVSSYKKCGHLGGKVLVPTSQFIQTLSAARLAADIMDIPTILMARTDAGSAKLVTSDIDPVDAEFLTGERTAEGFYKTTGGIEACIRRGLSYAPFADLLWFETSSADIDEATTFAEAIHDKYPGKMLAYNCSPSFNWTTMDKETIAKFQEKLGELGYKFQFITLAGFHHNNYGMFKLATDYATKGMTAYVELQQAEFESEKQGYRAIKHQNFVGTGYFDEVSLTLSKGQTSTLALKGSTEEEQFH